MKKNVEILSLFMDMTILKVDNQGNIEDIIVNTNTKFKVNKSQNIYTLFSPEEKFRLARVLESGFEVKKKYMELSKTSGTEGFVDVKLEEYEGERYIYIQFFESNREREVIYDRYIEKLTNLTERDPMTKVFNRQGFFDKIWRLVKNSDPQKRLGIIFLDIDKLKEINDTYGHKAGDKAILSIVDILVSTLRDRDIVARLGGDEFVIVVEEITGSKSTAYGLAERLRKEVAKEKKHTYTSTLSLGVHILEAGEVQREDDDMEKFSKEWMKHVNIADKATYQSKQNGRNQVSVSENFLKYYKLP